jgi:LacI family transcriptional regulator
MPRVALLIETSLGYGRGLLRGIVRYARLHGPWSFYVTPGGLEQILPQMDRWGCTGIIARITTARTEAAILTAGVPVIALDLSHAQLAGSHPLSRVSEVCPDSHEAGMMAAEHLLEKGLCHFAFIGDNEQPPWSTRREAGFRQKLAQAGHSCEVYPAPASRRDRAWGREQAIVSQWIRRLPKPVGLLACDDDRGRQALEACKAAGVHVPDDITVLGVDDDELLCEVSDPPLSSVKLDSEQGGYDAAALLDRLMSGHDRPPQRILVRPLWVVSRRSTDTTGLDDRMVAAALRFIHDNAARPIGVEDVVRPLGLSRRMLELRFRQATGRAIHEEIQRSRLERARRLLVETPHPLEHVACAAGFATASYMARVFRQAMGISPSQYRAQRGP